MRARIIANWGIARVGVICAGCSLTDFAGTAPERGRSVFHKRRNGGAGKRDGLGALVPYVQESGVGGGVDLAPGFAGGAIQR